MAVGAQRRRRAQPAPFASMGPCILAWRSGWCWI